MVIDSGREVWAAARQGDEGGRPSGDGSEHHNSDRRHSAPWLAGCLDGSAPGTVRGTRHRAPGRASEVFGPSSAPRGPGCCRNAQVPPRCQHLAEAPRPAPRRAPPGTPGPRRAPRRTHSILEFQMWLVMYYKLYRLLVSRSRLKSAGKLEYRGCKPAGKRLQGWSGCTGAVRVQRVQNG